MLADSSKPAPERRLSMTSLRSLALLVALLAALAAACPAFAQDPSTPPPDTPPSDPDAIIVGGPPSVPKTPAQLKDQAWTMLTSASAEDKRAESRIQCLAALGTMGSTPRSLRLLHDATSARDLDVRTAAVLADGQTRSPSVTTDLRQMLDDKEPQVAFAAALTLWKLRDRSGEDVLVAVANGGRSANATLVGGAEHTLHRELHSPSALARDGALQGASMLLGPFGMGITAYEYIHKNGGDSARVQAIEALAENRTEPIHQTLLAALGDRDLAVRAAAAKSLASYHDPATSEAISKLFYDPKLPVRYSAAAAYLICVGDAQPSPDPNAPQPPPPPPPARKSPTRTH